MRKQRLVKAGILAAAFGLMSVMLAAPAHTQQEGLGERLGERLDRGINRLSEEVREGWASLRRSVDRMGVQGRVYGRLRWDKAVATEEIEINLEGDGVVLLRGELKSERAKRKAVQLANDTVGVERVIDQLSVNPDLENEEADDDGLFE